MGVCWWAQELARFFGITNLAAQAASANAHRIEEEVLIHFDSVLMSEIKIEL